MRVYDHFPNPDCKGYTILNIHGYHGSPKNSAYTALHEIGCENIISPSIDYDSEEPSNIIGTLNMLRVQYKADMIVGTSLGGFYAAVLSARHDLSAMLVNPCLTPFLLDILSDFKTRPLVKLFGELAKIDSSNVSCIVGDDDEVLGNHTFTEKLLGNSRFRRIEGGKHSGATLPLKEFFTEMLDYYTNTLPLIDAAPSISPDILQD